jgi:hypothetical protein
MKGELSVDPVFTNLEILRPQLLLKKPLVALSNHRLFLG